MKSKYIYGAKDKYHRKLNEINPNISTHISRSEQNIHLPKGYIESMRIGKPDWWQSRFLDGSFNFSEGAVYPNVQKSVVDISPDEIRENVRRKGWKVTSGADYGLQDPTVFLMVAVDPVDGVAYVYDAYAKRQLPVPYHAKEMNRMLEHVPHGGLKGLIGDPSGKRRNINDRRSIFDHYAEYGLYFEPGDNRIDAGIMKVFSYFEMGKLKILKHLEDVIDELTLYHYKPTDMDERPSEKPADGEDHFCDTLRYIVQTFPDDPDLLKSVSYGFEDFRQTSSEAHLPFELRSDDQSDYNSSPDAWYNAYY